MADATTILPVLLRDLLRRWRVVTVIAAGVVIGVTLYAEGLPDEYDGTTIVAFSPRPGTGAGADIVRVDVPKYVEYVTARETVDAVASTLGERAGVLRRAVDASVAPDSGNLFITVRLGSPTRAANAANALATQTLTFAASDPLLGAVQVARALPESSPSGPPRRLYQAAGLLVGLLLGGAVALLLERGRPRIRTWQDVAIVTGYPVVGRIPPARVLRGAPADALADPAVGAAVRTLRTNLERVSRERPVHVLVITSPLPGEGKTTVAGALAVALARLDARILLVDADLRRPGAARLFPGPVRPGVAELLHGEADLDDAVRPGPVNNLSVLPTAADTDAGDLLARRFADVLRRARDRFDVIVVDAPPLLGADDARTLATLCDGVLLVVATDSLVGSVGEAAAALDALGVHVVGAVANRARDRGRFGSYVPYGATGAAPSQRP
ncbi:MAG TPA: CpsD/CapB family tyrosine-protein kinase [Acidimicrobiales bacterium]|nr:CpsD/CapB family tyrosine-protein kinase [Acidimicrobiales bacterium]